MRRSLLAWFCPKSQNLARTLGRREQAVYPPADRAPRGRRDMLRGGENMGQYRASRTGECPIMSKRFRYALMAAAAPLALAMASAQAATPTQTLVMAMDTGDIITMDPGESYEITGQEVGTNVYDRLLRYEAEDLNKLVGGVAESWTVGSDNKTFTFKLRPNLKFANGDPVTADDMAWSLQRVVILDKTPAFLFTQLGWTKDNVKTLIQATDPHTLTFKITEDFAPSLVMNLMSTLAASVVDKKVALSHEKDGDLGNGWLK